MLPQDPFMLLSFINMKLRDGDYADFEDFCLSEGLDPKEITGILASAGFTYNPSLRQFR
ncbi:MAG: DUF4250 domain-containing protein [Muribaculaceae bacterium]|nr:DUF4250 domain-containing protein [Muribaculaceae bacterium]